MNNFWSIQLTEDKATHLTAPSGAIKYAKPGGEAWRCISALHNMFREHKNLMIVDAESNVSAMLHLVWDYAQDFEPEK